MVADPGIYLVFIGVVLIVRWCANLIQAAVILRGWVG